MSEDKLTLLLAVVPGVPARGIVLCRVHERLIGRGCGLAVFLTDLIDKGKDLCSDLQVICVISSCCRPTFVNIGYRDRKTDLFAVCRNYENACSTGRLWRPRPNSRRSALARHIICAQLHEQTSQIVPAASTPHSGNRCSSPNSYRARCCPPPRPRRRWQAVWGSSQGFR